MSSKARDPILTEYSRDRRAPGRTPIEPRLTTWAFSLRLWKQIDLFGLDRIDGAWAVSLLERLGELSGTDIDELFTDYRAKHGARFHKIDWLSKNVPIRREDLNWLPKVYLDDEDDYPLYQFDISKTLGRVVGFLDENRVFQIVLLDPLHNLQPSKDFDYRIDKCGPQDGTHARLLGRLDQICAVLPDCTCKSRLRAMQAANDHPGVLLVAVTEDEKTTALKLVNDGHARSMCEIFCRGLLAVEQDSLPPPVASST